MAFLWLHSLAGAGWALAVLLLLALSLPAGRRLLSEWGTTVVDRHLAPLVRAVWTLTAVVVVTGVYNLRYEVPYKTPLSAAAAHRVFRLPFAEPYFVSLGAKLAAYTLMIGATVPLVRQALAVRDRQVRPAGAGEIDAALSPAVRVAALVLLVGGAVLWGGVVLIKYFHVLSEGARR